MNLLSNRTGVSHFKMQHRALERLLGLDPQVRGSATKLYTWLCSRTTPTNSIIQATGDRIQKSIGLANVSVTNSRRLLSETGVISIERQLGQGGSYSHTILNLSNRTPMDWTAEKLPSYFQVPQVLMYQTTYPHTPATDVLVYCALLSEMNRTGKNVLQLSLQQLAALCNSGQRTVRVSLKRLANSDVPYVRMERGTIEILHPETGNSMGVARQESDGEGAPYWYAPTGTNGRRRLNQNTFDAAFYEDYYRKSLPKPEEWHVGRDAHCPFHDDQSPSLSLDIRDQMGGWTCHACAPEGGGIVDFEMKLRKIDDKREAWKSVARKMNLKLIPKPRGRFTHRHIYQDERGETIYFLYRYGDGSARFSTPRTNGTTRPGLDGIKRTLYNLPQVLSSAVVIITEGEKKADILAAYNILDSEGQLVAVTCTGSWNTWRFEFVNYLVGKRVIILPDSDSSGERYREDIAASLNNVGIAFQSADFTDYGNDLRDYLSEHTVEQLIGFIDQLGWLMTPEERKDQHRLLAQQDAAVKAAIQGHIDRKPADDAEYFAAQQRLI